MANGRVELRFTEGIEQPWHWVVVAPNNKVVLTSENYHNKQDASYQAAQEAVFRDVEYVDTSEVANR